jgi:hypothetical protein
MCIPPCSEQQQWGNPFICKPGTYFFLVELLSKVEKNDCLCDGVVDDVPSSGVLCCFILILLLPICIFFYEFRIRPFSKLLDFPEF